MMKADRQPPKMSQRDPPALFPSPLALTMTPTGGRAQTPVQHRPYALKNTPPMTKRASTQKSYEEPTGKVATRRDTSTLRPYDMNYAPPPLKDPPDKPIPPKPPYSNGFINTPTSAPPNNASPPFAFGYKNEQQPSPSIDRSSCLLLTKRSVAVSHYAPAIEQRQQWETMSGFHAGI